MDKVKLIVAGCGHRGDHYARLATKDARVEIVGVAEPREFHRSKIAAEHSVPGENVFADWRQMAQRAKFADAVIIATQDCDHVEPAVAFADKKYAMLLEKPMAPNVEGCRTIVEAAIRNEILFGVCHVLRYTDFTTRLKSMIDAGAIGDVVSLQRLEPVGYWHQAHSFVRGNWRNEAESSFMLLAKSCHDLDWIRYIMGAKCQKVSSFGSLYHFRKEQKPEGAADSCLDCAVEPDCPYSAKRLYLGRVERGETGWPVSVLAGEVTEETITEALRTGPYGRCVYECDNDVVDNQVVNMQFEGGKTASFVMTAFTPMDPNGGRRTRVFGTRGMLEGDSTNLTYHNFVTNEVETIDTSLDAQGEDLGAHGGGDGRLIQHFVEAVATNDQSRILSGPTETLESHLMVFAAEKARLEGSVVSIDI